MQWADIEIQSERLRLRPFTAAEANLASRRIAEALGGKVVGQATTPKYASVTYRIPVSG